MATIFLRDPNMSLAVDTSYYTLRNKGKRVGKIPPSMVEQVIVEHGVEITRTALERLGATGVPVTFLTRDGKVQARLVAPWRKNASARLAQAKAYFDPKLRLTLANRFVDAKIANVIAVLKKHLTNHPNAAISKACNELESYRKKLKNAPDIPSLMGLEGSAARAYFQVLGLLLRPSWITFTGRNRRPPKDPGNAVLSYAYAVIHHEMLVCTEAIGLDPYIGFLHSNETRQPALALDLMEAFRPVLGDRLMFRLINLSQLREEHFEFSPFPDGGVKINKEGRHLLIESIHHFMRECDNELGEGFPSPGGLILREVQRFYQEAKEGDLYRFQPFYLDPSMRPHLA